MRAELRQITPNDYPDWETFSQADHPEPWDDYGWFVLDVGIPGEKGTTRFQALAATRSAVTRAKGNDQHRRLIVMDSFEPQALAAALQEYVASATGRTWADIIAYLRVNMYWEYERKWS